MRRTTAAATCALVLNFAISTHASIDSGAIAITVTGAHTGVLLNGLQIIAHCDAVAAGAVSAIVIDQCYITSNLLNHPSAAPGSATSSTFIEGVTTLEFAVCFHAYAIPALDPTRPISAGGCTADTGITPGMAGHASAVCVDVDEGTICWTV